MTSNVKEGKLYPVHTMHAYRSESIVPPILASALHVRCWILTRWRKDGTD